MIYKVEWKKERWGEDGIRISPDDLGVFYLKEKEITLFNLPQNNDNPYHSDSLHTFYYKDEKDPYMLLNIKSV